MERFAHIFEAHDRQVLVRRGENDDGDPTINLITEVQGAELSFALVFSPDPEAMDGAIAFTEAEAARDRAFDKVDALEEAATGFAKQLAGAESPMDALRLLSGK